MEQSTEVQREGLENSLWIFVDYCSFLRKIKLTKLSIFITVTASYLTVPGASGEALAPAPGDPVSYELVR